MRALPEKYFNNREPVLDAEDTSLDNNSNIFDSINNGTVDVTKLVDQNTDVELLDTISAPKITIQPSAEKSEIQQKPEPQISKEDTKKLESIEQSLSNLDKQIKVITDSLNRQPNNSNIDTKNNSDESLIENPKAEKNNNDIIEVVKRDRIVTNKIVDSKEYNNERLVELISTRNSLMQERQKILQSVYFNNETKNDTIFENKNNTENVNNTFSENNNVVDKSVENNAPVFLKEGGIVTEPTNAILGEAGPEAVIPLDNVEGIVNNNESISNLTNNEFFNNINEMPENILEGNTPEAINSQNAGEQAENITNSTQNNTNNFNTVNEQNLPGEESISDINVKDQSGAGELPRPTSEIAENASSIISVLKEIQVGIKALNEGLGGNFEKLGTSIEGIKNNVINNNTYNSTNVTGGQGASPQVGSKQRTPMPDYRSDLPDPGDFPPKFDLSMLGGTNLPNPQFIA